MKKYFPLFALLLALFALPANARAVETDAVLPDAPGEETIEYYREFDALDLEDAALPLSDAVWGANDTCYGDTLVGDAKTIYDNLEAAFKNNTATLQEIGERDLWMAYDVLLKNDDTDMTDWFAAKRDALLSAADAFVKDHPEYFWIRSAFSWGVRRGQVTGMWVGFNAQPSTDTPEKCAALNEKLRASVDAIIAATEGMPVAARLAYFDAWLADHNSYNYAALSSGIETDETPWSVIGSLVEGYAPVCEGYAKGFQLLCHEIGVPCLQVSGLVAGDGHMWTVVQLDGVWYFCDPTWDDPTGGDGSTTREYFLTAQPSSHVPNEGLAVPTVSSTGYFERGSLYRTASGGIAGGETANSGTMLIALYDGEGRLIACDTCTAMEWPDGYSIYWRSTTQMYFAPDFTAAQLARAAAVRRFLLADGTLIPCKEAALIA